MTARSINQFEIEVDKEVLLEAVKINRKEHLDNYEEAMEVYEEECKEALNRRLTALQNKDVETDPEVYVRQPPSDPDKWLRFDVDVPVSYGHVYDRLIAMLDMTDADTLVINGEQYRNWIEDQWDWSHRYEASTLSKLR